MKFVHLSDLHIGKRLKEYSLMEDQEDILKKILGIIDDEKPDGVLIAGDVYDKSIPPVEAVTLFDDFLVSLSKKNLQVFVISGNHDSAERIAFGGRLMNACGIHMSQVYNGEIKPVSMEDEYGKLNIWMMPFVKPIHVRKSFAEKAEKIVTYTDAMKAAIDRLPIDTTERNIMITHQFVTGSERADSEDEVSVGGTDGVDVSVFDSFDYTALGHLHRPQNCKSEKVRYCGTPLKYSFSEANDEKSVTVVELKEKGSLIIRTVPLVPLRDMVEIRGTYDEITLRDFYKDTDYCQAYIHITLTDEEDVYDAIGKLRLIYQNLMVLDYDNKRTAHREEVDFTSQVENKTPLELFGEFYEKQNNAELNDEQRVYLEKLIESVWEDEI